MDKGKESSAGSVNIVFHRVDSYIYLTVLQ